MAVVATKRGDRAEIPAPEARRRAVDPVLASDLRRRRPPGLVEQVVERAALLPEDDRSLVLAVYRDATPALTIAAVRGVSSRRIRRRVRVLVQRMLSPHFEFTMREMASWSAQRRQAARLVVLEGRIQREAAALMGVTRHTVRRHVEAIRMLEQASRAGGEEGGAR